MNTTRVPTFGLLLKRHRRAAGLTQEELAERAGLSPRAIGDLERDLRQPRRETLQLLLDALQLTPDEAARLEAAARAGFPDALGRAPRGPLLPVGSFLGAAPPGPLIGRQQEVHRILASIDAAVGGSGRLILLTGEPGIGKTRLAQEVSQEVRRRGFLMASGRCYEPERDAPFYPFLEALAAAYSLAPRAIRDEAPDRWPYLGQLLPEDALPAAARGQGGWMGGAGEEQRHYWAVSGFLAAIAQEMPVAILLDDLHWADDASLKLLLHLARRTRSDRLLLLGTYRDVEIVPQHALARALVDLNRERLVERVSIRRLDQGDTAGLIAATMGEIEVPAEFAALVHRRTDGNPFFIQEVLRALVERGEIYQEGGRWKRREVQGFQTPDTVRAAIGERLARLPPEAQAVLYRACVLGQTFTFEDVQALGNSPEEELDTVLEAAIAAGLIREEGMNAYAFTHALTQQALYEDLSLRRRRNLHLVAGEVLQRLPPGVCQQRVAELAWHFREGGDRERALAYTVRAGDRAAEVFAYGEAERLYRTALELSTPADPASDDSAQHADALNKLGRVLHMTERYDEALLILEQAAEVYRGLGNVAGEASTVTEIGWIHHNRGTDEEGIARVRPLVEKLERQPVSSRQAPLLAALYTALSRLHFGLGCYDDELAAADRASELAQEVGDHRLLAVAEARRGAALMALGRRPEARKALETGISLAEATGNLGTLSVALDNLGEIARDGGEYQKAQRDCERAVQVAEQTGVPGRIGWTLAKLGRVHLLTGEWPHARTLFERALRLLGDDPRSAAYPRIHLGQLDLLEGNGERGSGLVEAAMAAEEPGRDLWLRWLGNRLLAERDLLAGQPVAALTRLYPLVAQPAGRAPRGTVTFTLLFAPLAQAYLEIDREGEAEATLREGMERAHAQNHDLSRAELLRVQGMLQMRQERWQEARAALEEAITLAQRMPDPHREARARVELATLAARLGNEAEARDQLRAALAIFQRLGAHASIRRVQRLLADRH